VLEESTDRLYLPVAIGPAEQKPNFLLGWPAQDHVETFSINRTYLQNSSLLTCGAEYFGALHLVAHRRHGMSVKM
jgi:hypothetical protein